MSLLQNSASGSIFSQTSGRIISWLRQQRARTGRGGSAGPKQKNVQSDLCSFIHLSTSAGFQTRCGLQKPLQCCKVRALPRSGAVPGGTEGADPVNASARPVYLSVCLMRSLPSASGVLFRST